MKGLMTELCAHLRLLPKKDSGSPATPKAQRIANGLYSVHALLLG